MSTPEKTDARAEVVRELRSINGFLYERNICNTEPITAAIALLESDGARPAADLAKLAELVVSGYNKGAHPQDTWISKEQVDAILTALAPYLHSPFANSEQHAPRAPASLPAVNKKIEEKARILDWLHTVGRQGPISPDGWEYGVCRVKHDQNHMRHIAFEWTLSDHSDVLAAMRDEEEQMP